MLVHFYHSTGREGERKKRKKERGEVQREGGRERKEATIIPPPSALY